MAGLEAWGREMAGEDRDGLEDWLGLRHGLEAWGREGWLGVRPGPWGPGTLGLGGFQMSLHKTHWQPFGNPLVGSKHDTINGTKTPRAPEVIFNNPRGSGGNF